MNAFRCRGCIHDQETGFYYLQSRYYDPTTARFINADGTEGLSVYDMPHGTNLYAYCENNPSNHKDPTGRWIQYAIGAVLGGVLNVIFYAIDCAISKKSVSLWKALLNFLNGAVNGVIAATGAGVLWQIVAGITSGVVSLFIGAKEPSYEDFVIAVVSGILSGLLAGVLPKAAGKHINYLVKNFGKKVGKAFFKKAFGKTLLKAATYVFKNSKKLLWNFIKAYCLPNIYIGIVPRVKAVLGV